MNNESNTTPTMQASDDDVTQIDLRRYVQIVLKYKWVVLASVALGVTLTVLYTMRQPKIYQASASVVVDPAPPQVFGAQNQEVIQLGTGSYWSNQEYYNTELDILTSYQLAKLTVSKEELASRLVPDDPEIELSAAERLDAAAALLTRGLAATQHGESRVVRVSVRHADKALAIDLANEHIKTYVSYTRGLRTEGSGDVSKFLSTELDRTEEALRASEEALYQFKQDNEILSVSLEEKQNILATDIARYTAALSDARIKRIELDSVRKRAQKLTGEDVLESPIFALASNSATVEALKEQYVRERQRFLEISEDLGPKNSDYIKQKSKVDDLYAAVQREARRAMRELDERYKAAAGAEFSFTGEVERLKQEALELGPKTAAVNRLKRKLAGDEANYNLVLGRLSTSERSGRNEQTNIRDHEAARHAILVHPRMKLNVAISILLSTILGLGLAFLLSFLDRTLKSAEDVQQAIGVPSLGLIPILPDIAEQTGETLQVRDLYVFNNPKSRAAECCRSIRTNLLFSGADRPLNIITVSSPNPREGKTTSVIYLGTTMAQSGQRVLLVDTDMRRPRLHKSMGVSRGLGLSNLILGDCSYEDAIKTSEIPNLFVLPCGPTPPNPAELLLTNRFKEILGELGNRFDRILLDSPPLQAVTDAAVLSKLSDGVIVVIKAGKTNRDDLIRSYQQLRDVNAHMIGVVLNALDLSNKQHGYYYYAYGYGEDATGAELESSNA